MTAESWLKDRLTSGALSWGELVSAIQFAQSELGVVADGKWGRKSARALTRRSEPPRDGAIPIPTSRHGVRQVYGDFSWEHTKGRFIDIDDAWERKNIRWFLLHDGRKRRMHRLVGDEFARIYKEACEASGYTPKSTQTYVPRKISTKPGGKLSYHSWGIAVDFDPARNSMGCVDRSTGGQCLFHSKYPEFVRVFERAGWGWGGRWRMLDCMHFERKSPGRDYKDLPITFRG